MKDTPENNRNGEDARAETRKMADEPPTVARRCDNCNVRKPLAIAEKDLGECRRNAPVGPRDAGLITPGDRWRWPVTHADEWCGEHEFLE